jgi:hypothetical protein
MVNCITRQGVAMIRLGKRAKVTYAKHAETSAPVEGVTLPVHRAAVTPMEMKGQKQAELVRLLPQEASLKSVVPGTTVSCSVDKPRLQKKACKDVKEDITIKTLFAQDTLRS